MLMTYGLPLSWVILVVDAGPERNDQAGLCLEGKPRRDESLELGINHDGP